MRTRTFLLAMVVAVIGGGLLAPGVVAKPAKTKIKDVEVVPDDSFTTATYSGRVDSKKGKCRKRRRVKVIHESDPPFVIGETTTDEDGNWSISGPLPPGPEERITIEVSKKPGCKGKAITRPVGDFID